MTEQKGIGRVGRNRKVRKGMGCRMRREKDRMERNGMQSSMERGQVWNEPGSVGTESRSSGLFARWKALLDCRVVEGVLLDCRAAGLLDRLLLGMSTVGLSNRRADALALLRPEYPGEGVLRAAGTGKTAVLLSRPDGGGAGCGRRIFTTENNAATGVLQRCFGNVVFGAGASPTRVCRRFGGRLSRRIPGRQILSSSTVRHRRIGASNVMR